MEYYWKYMQCNSSGTLVQFNKEEMGMNDDHRNPESSVLVDKVMILK